MRIVADDQIFAGSAHPELHELLLACRDGRHQLEVLPPAAPCLKQWLVDHAGSVREHYQEILDTSQRELAISARRVTLSIPKVPLQVALILVKTPLCVLVENERNDGAFLRAVLRGPREQEWRAALQKDWLAFDSPGGMQEVEKRIQSETVDPRRTYVVCDSDARRPSEPSQAAQRLARLCQQKSIRHHLLQRRASENYLPIAALSLWVEEDRHGSTKPKELRRLLKQFQALSPPMRHHFHMKAGLAGDAKEPSELFSDLNPFQSKALQSGFGKDVGQIFRDPARLLDEWLLDDGQRDEMESLLDDILALL